MVRVRDKVSTEYQWEVGVWLSNKLLYPLGDISVAIKSIFCESIENDKRWVKVNF
jgi:hypothetical protein